MFDGSFSSALFVIRVGDLFRIRPNRTGNTWFLENI